MTFAERSIGMLAGGMSARVVARRFGCCQKTIDRLADRYQQVGTVHDRQRPGRPRVTTARAYRFITLTHLRQRQLAATVTARQYGVSGQTICNRLRRNARTLVRLWPNVTVLPGCYGRDVIWTGEGLTGTEFCSPMNLRFLQIQQKY